MTPLLLMAASLAATPRGSSTLRDSDGVRHTADRAFDGLMKTGWAEGDAGYGAGSWLELSLDRKTTLNSVSLWPGDLSQGARSHREHSRPKLIRVFVDGQQIGEPIRLQDKMARVDLPLGGIEGRTVRIVVDEVWKCALRLTDACGGRKVWECGLDDVYSWKHQPFMPVE